MTVRLLQPELPPVAYHLAIRRPATLPCADHLRCPACEVIARRTVHDTIRARCTRLGWWWRTRFVEALKSVHDMTGDPERFVAPVMAGLLAFPLLVVLLGGHLLVLLCLKAGIRPFAWPEGPEWPDKMLEWAHGLAGHRWIEEGRWTEGVPDGVKEWAPGAARRILLRCRVCLARSSRRVHLGGNPSDCW